MASINRVFLMGNLGSDPELRSTPGGQPVAQFRIATNEAWVDKGSGQKQERTEWHRIVVWGRQAEHCNQYLRKGRTVFIEGRIQTRQWDDQQGVKHFMTEIVANNVQFIGQGGPGGARDEGHEGHDGPMPEPAGRDQAPAPAISDDDVPF
jgi:single-strand DNA-binding protein